MRIVLIIFGLLLAVLVGAASAGALVLGLASVPRMSANAETALVQLRTARPLGLLTATSDVWLWGRCVRPFAEGGRGGEADLSRRKGCSRKAASHAERLSKAEPRYAARRLSARWFEHARALAVPGDWAPRVAYARGVLAGDVVPSAWEVASPYGEGSLAAITLLAAAWDGYVPAMEPAAEMLMRDGSGIESSLFGRQGEAYALLLLARANGIDVDTKLALMIPQLPAEQRWLIEDWLESAGKLPRS